MRSASITDQAFYRSPFGTFARMRDEGALVRTRIPVMGNVWLTTTHAAARQVLKDDANFTQRSQKGRLAGLQWWMPRSLKVLANNMLTSDGEAHRRLRTLVDEAFRRRNVHAMEGGIESLAVELADRMADRGSADLVSDFARQLPLLVISELLGLPREDRGFFIKTADAFSDVTGLMSFFRMIPALRRLSAYLETKLTNARETGGDGLIAELVAEAEAHRASPDELLATAFLLLIAGHETTTHLISGSMKAILDEPEKREWLREDFSRLDLAVEEFLRFVSPVQMTKPRHARTDMEIGGDTVKAGDLVVPLLAAANADPAVFDRAESLILDRRPNPHLAFGTGVHFCLGNQLARIEAKIALKTLLQRFPAMSLACGEDEIRWRKRIGLRAIVQLPVRL